MTAEVRPLDAESSVIGSILVDSRCLPVVEQLLRPEDLALAVHQTIYRAAVSLRRQDKPIDSVLIREEAAREGVKLDVPYLVELMDATPTAQNVEEYARLTRQNSLKRAVVRLCSEAREQAAEGDPGEVLAGLARDAAELQREGVTDDLIRPEEALMAFYEHRDAVDRGKATGCVSTGYRDIDLTLGGGMLAGGMYILAARPGMGKTTLALNIADRVAEKTGPVLFVSLEMDVEQLVAKRVSRLSGIPANRLLMERLSDQDYTKMAEAAGKLEQIPLYINRRPGATVEQIEILARRVPGLTLLVVDYVGKISPSAQSYRNSDRYNYMTEISGALKTLARTLKIPILALCQLNRANEASKDKRPQLSNLRDTGALEQDADGVIFLYREAYYNPEGRPAYEPEPIEVIVDKNRHGPTGTCELAFALAVSKVFAMSNDPREAARRYLRTTAPMEQTKMEESP